MRSIADLMVKVAEHLTGEENLEVIFRDPPYRLTDGCCYKSASGKPIIELKPYLDEDRTFYVLLHECAHAVLHRQAIRALDVRSRPSGSMEFKRESNPNYKRHEDEADALANKWLTFAKKHARREQGMSELEACLWCLLKY